MAYYTNNILLTGFWPPTNEMLRQFSTKPAANPGGWEGRNWRGRGFDIYSYFPEFDKPPDEVTYGDVGFGDLPVDYQMTRRSWEWITAAIRPCAIITFSRGYPDSRSWEIESRQRNLAEWGEDYVDPRQPTPSPPDPTVPANFIRHSTLPMEEIRRRIDAADHLDIRTWIDTSNEFAGGFLSEFIAYLGAWYRDEHVWSDAEPRCFEAGHIHVGEAVDIPAATEATEITLEAVIDDLRRRLPSVWVSAIGFRVGTEDAAFAGTDSLITVEIIRDGDHLFTGRLDFGHLDDHERGDSRFYGFTVPELYLDETSRLPEGIGRIPMPYPNTGIEFSNGIHPHLKCRLRIHADDMWIKDVVEIYIKEAQLDGASLAWAEAPIWTRLGAWTQDVPMSRDSSEGETTWTLLT